MMNRGPVDPRMMMQQQAPAARRMSMMGMPQGYRPPARPMQAAGPGAAPLAQEANTLAQQGRNGDTMLAHLNPAEAALLAILSGKMQPTQNPVTGLAEFWPGEGDSDGGAGPGVSVDGPSGGVGPGGGDSDGGAGPGVGPGEPGGADVSEGFGAVDGPSSGVGPGEPGGADVSEGFGATAPGDPDVDFDAEPSQAEPETPNPVMSLIDDFIEAYMNNPLAMPAMIATPLGLPVGLMSTVVGMVAEANPDAVTDPAAQPEGLGANSSNDGTGGVGTGGGGFDPQFAGNRPAASAYAPPPAAPTDPNDDDDETTTPPPAAPAAPTAPVNAFSDRRRPVREGRRYGFRSVGFGRDPDRF